MATHYKGERIDELLGEIDTLQQKLNEHSESGYDNENLVKFSTAYALLVMAKAKLTALQGE